MNDVLNANLVNDVLNVVNYPLSPFVVKGSRFHLPLRPLPGKDEQLYDKNLLWDGLNVQKRE